MNKTIKITGEPQRANAIEQIKILPLEPMHVITIKEFKESKTNPQIRTVHMWIKEVRTFFQESRGVFHTDENIKDWLKGLFGLVEIYDTPGGKRKRYKSFSKYTKEEMQEFMEVMQLYCAAELFLALTIPNHFEEGL